MLAMRSLSASLLVQEEHVLVERGCSFQVLHMTILRQIRRLLALD